mgnify:CR=1 FL=1
MGLIVKVSKCLLTSDFSGKFMRFKIVLVTFVLLSAFACSTYYKKANENAVEKLNAQIKKEKYDEIYSQSSEILKRTISKEEFNSKMKIATERMKEFDDSLTWKKDETALFDKSISRDDNFSYRIVSKNEKKTGIQINWNESFRLCGLSVVDYNDGNGNSFRYCD